MALIEIHMGEKPKTPTKRKATKKQVQAEKVEEPVYEHLVCFDTPPWRIEAPRDVLKANLPIECRYEVDKFNVPLFGALIVGGIGAGIALLVVLAALSWFMTAAQVGIIAVMMAFAGFAVGALVGFIMAPKSRFAPKTFWITYRDHEGVIKPMPHPNMIRWAKMIGYSQNGGIIKTIRDDQGNEIDMLLHPELTEARTAMTMNNDAEARDLKADWSSGIKQKAAQAIAIGGSLVTLCVVIFMAFMFITVWSGP